MGITSTSNYTSSDISVYNGDKFLAKAIDSVLCQEFYNFEFIIVLMVSLCTDIIGPPSNKSTVPVKIKPSLCCCFSGSFLCLVA